MSQGHITAVTVLYITWFMVLLSLLTAVAVLSVGLTVVEILLWILERR